MIDSKTYLPGLDGLRCIAALCILVGHIPQKDFVSWDVASLPIPSLCAYLFLVLSGFLAGYKSSKINSAIEYYKSKAKRILPVYFLCIAIVVFCSILLKKSEDVLNWELAYYLCLLPNIPFCSSTGILPLVHLWYIGVLVMFYLSVPFVVKASKTSRIIPPLAISLFWLILKWSLYIFIGKDTFIYKFVGCTAFDILFLGFLVGIMASNESQVISKIADNKFVSIFTWVLFITLHYWGAYIPAPARTEVFAVISVLLILGQLSDKILISLENKPLKWIGNISYEIYVIQIPVIISLSYLFEVLGIKPCGIIVYTICIIITILAALILKNVRLITYLPKRIIKKRDK